jgi:hypothetical protein
MRYNKHTLIAKRNKLPEFPDYGVGPVISEPTLAGSSGAPIDMSRKGIRLRRIDRGRGKVFPTCEPDRVTTEGILSEEIMGSKYFLDFFIQLCSYMAHSLKERVTK